MKQKLIIGLLIIGIFVLSGCTQQQSKYVCPDGSIVSDTSFCPKQESSPVETKSYCGDGICQNSEIEGNNCPSDCPRFEFRGSRGFLFGEDKTVINGNKCSAEWMAKVLNDGKKGTDTIIVRAYDKFDWQQNNHKTIKYEKSIPIPETARDESREIEFEVAIDCQGSVQKANNNYLWDYELKNSGDTYKLSEGWEPRQVWD